MHIKGKTIKSLLLALLFTCILAGGAFAFSVVPVTDIDAISPGHPESKIVKDSNDNLHIVYQKLALSSYHLYHRSVAFDQRNDMANWDSALAHSAVTNFTPFQSFDLCIDNDDNLYLAYVEEDKVYYVKYDATLQTWGSAEHVTGNAIRLCSDVSIATDGQNVKIAYVIENTDTAQLYVEVYDIDGTRQSFKKIDSLDRVLSQPSIAVDSSSNYAVAWVDNHHDLAYRLRFAWSGNPSQYRTLQNISMLTDPQITVDQDHEWNIVYLDDSSLVQYIKVDDSGTEIFSDGLHPIPYNCESLSATISQNDLLHVSYSTSWGGLSPNAIVENTTYDTNAYSYDNSGYVTEEGYDLNHPDVFVDDNGDAFIAYYNEGSGRAKYAEIDYTAPSVPVLITPDNYDEDNDGSVYFAWDPVHDIAPIDHYELSIRNPMHGDLLIDVGTAEVYGNIVHTESGLLDGTYEWDVTVFNIYSEHLNTVSTSSTISFIVDTQPPSEPTLVSPAEGEILLPANEQPITFSWVNAIPVDPTLVDGTMRTAITGTLYVINPNGYIREIDTFDETVESITPSSTFLNYSGENSWYLEIVDNAGNVTSSDAVTFYIDGAIPGVEMTYPLVGDPEITDTDPNFEGRAYEENSYITNITVNVWGPDNDALLAASEEVYSDAGSTTEVEFNYQLNTPLSSGTYKYSMWVSDNLGNSGERSLADWYFTINSSDDDAPSTALNINGTALNGWYSEDPQTIELSAVDYGIGNVYIETHYTFENLTTGTIISGTCETTNGLIETINISEDGEWQATYYSIDNRGNTESTQTTNFQYDNTELSAIADLSLVSYDTETATLSWTDPFVDYNTNLAETDYYLVYYYSEEITGANIGSATSVQVDATQTSMQTDVTGIDLLNNTYYFAVKSVDMAGNISDLSNTDIFATALIDLVDTIEISPDTVSVRAGGEQIFDVYAYDSGSNLIGGIENSVLFSTPNAAVGTMTDNILTASENLGTYDVIAYIYNNNGDYFSSTATVNIVDMDTMEFDPTEITVAAGDSTSVNINATNNLVETITDLENYNITLSVDISGLTVTRTGGTVDLTAGATAGNYVVTATYEGVDGTISAELPVTITAADAANITLDPDPSASNVVLTYGKITEIIATVTDDYGNHVTEETVVLDSTLAGVAYGENVESVTIDGVTVDITYYVVPELTLIDVAEVTDVQAVSTDVELTITAVDSQDNSLTYAEVLTYVDYGLALTLSADDGTFSDNVYTTPANDGNYDVTVTYTAPDGSEISDSTTIIVSSTGPTITYTVNDEDASVLGLDILGVDDAVIIDPTDTIKVIVTDVNGIDQSSVSILVDEASTYSISELSVTAFDVGGSVVDLGSETVNSLEIDCSSISLTEGEHTVKTTATDNAGSSSESTITFRTYDSLALTGIPMNYPNPFNPIRDSNTTIKYTLTQNTDIKLAIYDITGNHVLHRAFPSGTTGGSAGDNYFTWNGQNDFGKVCGNGVYIYFIISGGTVLGNGEIAIYQ